MDCIQKRKNIIDEGKLCLDKQITNTLMYVSVVDVLMTINQEIKLNITWFLCYVRNKQNINITEYHQDCHGSLT